MARRPPLRCAVALGVLALAVFALLAYTPLIGAVSRRLDAVPDPGPADAIVVLGAGSSWAASSSTAAGSPPVSS
jgi:hypothetical protein